MFLAQLRQELLRPFALRRLDPLRTPLLGVSLGEHARRTMCRPTGGSPGSGDEAEGLARKPFDRPVLAARSADLGATDERFLTFHAQLHGERFVERALGRVTIAFRHLDTTEHRDYDTDGDSHCAAVDNCPGVANPTQSDNDDDGLGDACDPTEEDGDLDAEDVRVFTCTLLGLPADCEP